MRERIPRVLIVDDEIGIARMLRLLLSDEFDVDATTSPERACALLTSGLWFDVVLCDVMMPGMSGMELRNHVHASHPEVAERIVFITGGIVGLETHALLAELPNLVLQKPLDTNGLREMIRRRKYVEPRRDVVGS